MAGQLILELKQKFKNMKPYNELKVGDLFVISKGIEFWSIALQENVISTRDIVIKITNTCIPENNFVFGIIQLVFQNFELAALMGNEIAKGYVDKKNGEIEINYSKLKEYNKNSLYF
jgi:hypothetical protein